MHALHRILHILLHSIKYSFSSSGCSFFSLCATVRDTGPIPVGYFRTDFVSKKSCTDLVQPADHLLSKCIDSVQIRGAT
ncbi:hypothetical protein PF005_g29844, partial [Phytophthora fragariae]